MRGIFMAWALLAAVAGQAWADVDPRFAELRDKARPLGGLGMFLESYVGRCGDALLGKDCASRSEAFRAKATHTPHYMILHEGQVGILAPGAYVPATGEYEINITPLFSDAGLAVTEGVPLRLDPNGNPVLPVLTVKGRLSGNWNAGMFMNLFSRKGLRVQVVFTPLGTWSLAGPKGKKVQGVKARIDGLLVTEARTGDAMGLWLPESTAPRPRRPGARPR
jgi:hypothetical protein